MDANVISEEEEANLESPDSDKKHTDPRLSRMGRGFFIITGMPDEPERVFSFCGNISLQRERAWVLTLLKRLSASSNA